ncbi:acyl-CoA thioesterase [Bradyrhizobium sp. CSA207]|uniref:acyl-CoA thioesterase n=1 Tax=Bradyrhizobium sp. CSA207 TaxID=2698826 RepID=UPI0023B169E9|nr:thioesterase family protein [Bradyrhizobium sp. CSA207]MDE5445768.1 acyl-CoA thioesterase [Bradyrhizobium sp. CSA207]
MAARSAPSRASDYKAWRAITTRWLDNDAYGHMNNVVHYSLFDSAVNGWLIEKSMLDINGGGQIGLVVETGCRYFSELAFPDLIRVGLRADRIGTSSVRYRIGLFRSDSEIAAAEGYFVHVYVDRKTRRPKPIPESFRCALKEILVSDNGDVAE